MMDGARRGPVLISTVRHFGWLSVQPDRYEIHTIVLAKLRTRMGISFSRLFQNSDCSGLKSKSVGPITVQTPQKKDYDTECPKFWAR